LIVVTILSGKLSCARVASGTRPIAKIAKPHLNILTFSVLEESACRVYFRMKNAEKL
jgi:hypothetical protein